MPALNRLPPASIAATLTRARDAPEPGSIMARFAAQLSDPDIEALARQLGRSGRP
jgi:cytochrome c553